MTSPGTIYLDNNATTQCDPRVVERMLPYFTEVYGNPSNGYHSQGRMAARAIDDARGQIADLIGAQPDEIFFTSGATESDNLAIFGLIEGNDLTFSGRVVTSAIEHKAVLLPCNKLAERHHDVVFVPVTPEGVINISDAINAITPGTTLVSIQLANNEIGTIQPIREIAEHAHAMGALFHTDAAQAVGKIPVSVNELGVDLLSVSAHKLYGPKGVGALFVRGGVRRIPLAPLFYGGGQERGVRSGTSNVPSIVGFGEAARISAESLATEYEEIERLRDKFESALAFRIPGIVINGQASTRLPNTSSLTFPDVDADAILLNLKDVMLGTGSACNSGAMEPSQVLQAMGVPREAAQRTIRASLGRFNSESQIDIAVDSIVQCYERAVELS